MRVRDFLPSILHESERDVNESESERDVNESESESERDVNESERDVNESEGSSSSRHLVDL